MVSEYKLHIGSYGWQYKKWQESFYPEDLPEDWQFSYYANEYSVIMVPWELVQNNFELLEQGIEDSDEKCRVLFELAVQNLNSTSKDTLINSLDEFLNKISFFGERVMGLVLTMQHSELQNLSSEKLDLIKEILRVCQTQLDTCIDIAAYNSSAPIQDSLQTEFLELLNSTGIDLCRFNDTRVEVLDATTSKLHITFCDSVKADAKQMRKIVENSLVGECEGSINVLIFRSEIPNHEQMNTAAIISDLL
ncbi:MAG: hypothetical protein ACC653_07370 [Gammaproteobacteria bacterium]